MKDALAEYVRRVRRDKNLSTSDVEKAAKGKISDAYVSQIENGYVKNVSIEKLAALAEGLSEPLDDVIGAASGRTEPPTRFEMYAERFDAHDLTETEWQFLELHFRDQVNRFRHEKEMYRQQIITAAEKEPERRPQGPIAAITSPTVEERLERERIQRSLNEEEPRKRKAG